MKLQKKILMWNSYEIKPTGGPSGYLYNIKEYTQKNNIDNIYFLNNYNIKNNTKNDKNKFKNLIKNIIPKKSYNKLNLYRWINKKLFSDINLEMNLDDYDFIHFHSTWELYQAKNLLKNYKGEVILTSHSPKAYHKEVVEDNFNLNFKKLNSKFKNILEIMDLYSFSRADHIIFPTRYSQEPYINSWTDYRNIIDKNKIFYVPTGIKSIKNKNNKSETRKKYGIKKNEVVISYVGRHNYTKGFDLIKKFAKKIWEKKEVVFLIAGKEKPIKGLKDQKWIEVGWTDDPHSIIEASDLFILPNRETYFDLVLLEALSLNKPILLSETGGNKYFKKFKKNDLYYFDRCDIEDMVEKFNVFFDDYKENNISHINSKIFEQNFTIDKFIYNYFELINYL